MLKKLIIIISIIFLLLIGGCSYNTEDNSNYILTIKQKGQGEIIKEESKLFSFNKIVKLLPVANSGWLFNNWDGENGDEVEYNHESNNWEIILNDDKIIKAVFVPEKYNLNISIEGQGTVIKEKIETYRQSTYDYGSMIRITAQGDPNYVFSSWQGDINSENNPEEILMDCEKNIIAVFKEKPSISGEITVDYDFAQVNASDLNNKTIKYQNIASSNDEYINNEMIIGFPKGLSKEKKSIIIKETGAKLVKYLDTLNAAVINTSDYTQNMLLTLESNNDIKYFEPNYRVYALGSTIPNDPLYNSQWNYRMIDLQNAWNYETGNNIKIAVIDTGVSINHSDLDCRIDSENGYNFLNNTNDINDDHGHGTHVSGIIGAVTNNSNGIAGTTWSNEILPIKVLNEYGTGSYDGIAQAIMYAAGLSDNPTNPEPVDLINLSLGGCSDSQLLKDAIDQAHNEGILIIASSGNNNNNSLLYPAQYEETIAVGAVDSIGERCDYSNYSTNLDIVAPGGSKYYGVLSTYLDNGYDTMAGTSMAAPHVSGLISLMLANGINYRDVRNILHSTTVHPGQDIFSEEYGHGIINANFALNDVEDIKVIIGNRNGNIIEKALETKVSLKGGNYIIDNLPVGEYSVFAWIDVTDDNIINTGDYIKESTLVEFKPERNYQKDLTIYID